MFSCSPFFLFGKDGDFLSAKNTFPEASGNAPPTFKCFPKLRKPPRRRKNAFRNFGNPRAHGKTLSETSGSPTPTEKHFPKLRETPRRRKSTFRSYGISPAGRKYKKSCHNKLATALLLSIKKQIIPRTKSGHRQPQPNR